MDNVKMSPEDAKIQDLEAVCGTQADEIERLTAELNAANVESQEGQEVLGEANARIAEMTAELDKERKDHEEECEDHSNTIGIAFIDPGANPPVAWKDIAEQKNTQLAAMREALVYAEDVLSDFPGPDIHTDGECSKLLEQIEKALAADAGRDAAAVLKAAEAQADQWVELADQGHKILSDWEIKFCAAVAAMRRADADTTA